MIMTKEKQLLEGPGFGNIYIYIQICFCCCIYPLKKLCCCQYIVRTGNCIVAESFFHVSFVDAPDLTNAKNLEIFL